MKKLVPFLLAGMLASPVMAQHSVIQPKFVAAQSPLQYDSQQAALQIQDTFHTLDEYFVRATDFGVYMYDVETQNGTLELPITGTNDVYLALGTKYDFSGTARVHSVLVAFAARTIVGTPDILTASIYSLPSASSPVMTELGGQAFSTEYIDTSFITPSFTSIDFMNPVPINSNFVVMIQTIAPAEGANIDFLSIMSNQQGDGKGERRASALAINDQSELYYADLADLFDMGEPLDIDPMIIPIIEFDATSGVDEYATLNGLTLKGTYPSPASQNTTVHFALDKPSFVEISIIDMTGRVVSTVRHNTMEAGNHTLDLDVSTLPTGSYMYAISTKTARVGGKLAVTR